MSSSTLRFKERDTYIYIYISIHTHTHTQRERERKEPSLPLLVHGQAPANLEDGEVLLGVMLASEGVVVAVLGFAGLLGRGLAALEVSQRRPHGQLPVDEAIVAAVVPVRQVRVVFHLRPRLRIVLGFRLLNLHPLGRRVSARRAPAPLALRLADLGVPLVGHSESREDSPPPPPLSSLSG